jgi:hypothetical protein
MVRNSSEEIRRAIELKNQVQEAIKKYEDLNIANDGEITNEKNTKISNNNQKSSKSSLPGTSKSFNNEVNLDDNDILDENEKKKRDKLKIAPFIDLNELHYFAPKAQKVEINHPLFHQRENDNELLIGDSSSSSDTSRLIKKTFVGKFEPVKWSCRAPLKNGKLCPRMDRIKCPLHGKIVARDEFGNIANESDRIEYEERLKAKLKETNEDKPWLDTELIADINAATGKNIISTKESIKNESKKRKSGNLTNLTKEENASRKRLEKMLLNPKQLNKVGSILDSIERRQHYEKFQHKFNYALQS